MGYYTRHSIKINENRTGKTDANIKEKTITIFQELDLIGYAFNENLETAGEPCKWYEHQSDMKKLTTEIKDVVFLLEGEGEESEDIWKEYWLNGTYQRCQAKLIFDNFDESKLKLPITEIEDKE